MRRRRQFRTKKEKKEEREFLIYIKIGFILEKDHKQVLVQFHISLRVYQKSWGRYWSLMVKRKYKIRKKIRRKYKKKSGKGFGDGFKYLYSLGKQWRKSMQ